MGPMPTPTLNRRHSIATLSSAPAPFSPPEAKETPAPKEPSPRADRMVTSVEPGKYYLLAAPDGRELAHQPDGSLQFTRDRGTLLYAEGTGDGKIGLLSPRDNRFLSAQAHHGIALSPNLSGWEAFTPEKGHDGKVQLRSHHDTVLGFNPISDSLDHASGKILETHKLNVALKSPRDPKLNLALANPRPPISDAARAAEVKRIVDLAKAPGNAPRIAYTFWDKGFDKMPEFYKLNIEHWKTLNPGWDVKVINVVEGDESNAFNVLSHDDLPRSFEQMNPVNKSDAIRLQLLKKTGGVWLDASNILIKTLDEICWNEISDPKSKVIQHNFTMSAWGSDHLGRKDYVENWFIAAPKNSELLANWGRVFNHYWDERSSSDQIWAHPQYRGINLDNFTQHKPLDFRNYLTQHVAIRKLIEHDPVTRQLWEDGHMQLPEAGDRACLIANENAWFEPLIFRKMVDECDHALVDRLMERSDLAKFTSAMAKGLNAMPRDVLLDSNRTIGLLYQRIRERAAASVKAD
jgi:hypothetical protein